MNKFINFVKTMKYLSPMDFKIVNTQLETQFKEIRRRIFRLQSGGTIDSLITIGANTENQIGASYVSLKQLASNYVPNEPLALLLWHEQKREEQIIACFLLPDNLNVEKITQLCNSCLSFEISEYLGSIYLHKHPLFQEISTAWLDSESPYLQIAALTALSRYFILHKGGGKISKEFYEKSLQREYKHKYVQLLAQRFQHNL